MIQYYWLFCLFYRHGRYVSSHQLENRCDYFDIGKQENLREVHCPANNVCEVNITYIHMPPYSEKGKKILDGVVRNCCGICASISKMNTFRHIKAITASNISSSNFILPIIGNSADIMMYGYYFIPVGYLPNGMYITPQNEPGDLIMSSLKVWPLLLLCIFLTAISGFIIWILETTGNKKEFPRSFLRGWTEGCWWSIITLTTVGYGDKTPRTTLARCFSVVWIMIGITLFGILTGFLTTAIMNADSPPTPNMAGCRVGILKHRVYDASFVSKHGGIVIESNQSNDFCQEISELAIMLMQQHIDGIFLDKITLSHAIDVLCNTKGKSPVLEEAIQFFLTKTIQTEKVYPREKLSLGMIVKNIEHYDYYRNIFITDRLDFETALEMDMVKQFKKFQPGNTSIFSPSSKYFLLAIKVTSGVLAVMLLSGILYEIVRQKSENLCRKTRNSETPPSKKLTFAPAEPVHVEISEIVKLDQRNAEFHLLNKRLMNKPDE